MSIAWQSVLDCTQAGPRPNLTNAVRVLHREPMLSAEHIWYDEFLDRIMIANSPVREWSDEDDLRLTVFMQEEAGMNTIQDGTVNKAVKMVARQRTRNVVRDWLESLTWDHEDRIAFAFEEHWGVERGIGMPDEYVRSASSNFFIGMVARIFSPGCQLDTMLVFEGWQGAGKTSALRLLGGQWYGMAHESVQKKDFFEALKGKWLIEIGEMDAFQRAELTRVKTVVSTPTDRYRPSYGRASQDFPRQCVFAGTTNKDEWGNDETGLRRFWPIRCGHIDLASLSAARTQLFAEAVVKYKAGWRWWNMPEEATLAVQSERQSQHPWTDPIVLWLTGKDETTIAQVLTDAIKKPTDKHLTADAFVVGRVLTLNGWRKHGERNGTSYKVCWRRIES